VYNQSPLPDPNVKHLLMETVVFLVSMALAIGALYLAR
jgi:hypothetical protein